MFYYLPHVLFAAVVVGVVVLAYVSWNYDPYNEPKPKHFKSRYDYVQKRIAWLRASQQWHDRNGMSFKKEQPQSSFELGQLEDELIDLDREHRQRAFQRQKDRM